MPARSRKQYVPEPETEAETDPGEEPSEAGGARSFWSGTLSFGLVTVPVSLYSAQRPGHASLRMLAPDGTPLIRRFYCPADGKWVDRAHVVRGYPIAEDRYVRVTDQELEALAPDKSHDIELRRFVDAAAVSPAYFEHAYVLGPRTEAVRAYRLLATAMDQSGKAGIATFVMRGKEHLVAIFASGGLLRAHTLRFADELRAPDEVGLPRAEPADPKRVRALRQAIQRAAKARFEPGARKNGYWAKLAKLVAEKEARGRDLVVPEAPEAEPHADVIDLMAVLKQSLGTGATATQSKRRPTRTRTPRPRSRARGATRARRRGRPAARPKRARSARSG
jgi:DNA end-binding protein Ku